MNAPTRGCIDGQAAYMSRRLSRSCRAAMLLLFSPRLNPERECVRTTLDQESKILPSQDPSSEREAHRRERWRPRGRRADSNLVKGLPMERPRVRVKRASALK